MIVPPASLTTVPSIVLPLVSCPAKAWIVTPSAKSLPVPSIVPLLVTLPPPNSRIASLLSPRIVPLLVTLVFAARISSWAVSSL